MKKISDELNRIEKIFDNLEIGKHRTREYKEDREWWVLGKLKMIFQNENLNFPNYAEKLEENDTDFNISYDGEVFYKGLQITEVVPLEYKYREIKDSNVKMNIWEYYEDVLMNKLNMHFGPNNWLVIYFDELYSKINNNGYWHNVILERSKKLNLSKNTYEKILAIDSRGDAAVSLYPYLFVISPEWNHQSTIIDQCLYRKNTYYKNIKGI
jgi:hypothetical protein